jgi:hypothetical protein
MFRDKYLKYKHKYLKLRQKAGSMCDRILLPNTLGTCWNLAIQNMFYCSHQTKDLFSTIFESKENFELVEANNYPEGGIYRLFDRVVKNDNFRNILMMFDLIKNEGGKFIVSSSLINYIDSLRDRARITRDRNSKSEERKLKYTENKNVHDLLNIIFDGKCPEEEIGKGELPIYTFLLCLIFGIVVFNRLIIFKQVDVDNDDEMNEMIEEELSKYIGMIVNTTEDETFTLDNVEVSNRKGDMQ